MPKSCVRAAVFLLLVAVSAWAGKKTYVLKSLTPVVDKKPVAGYSQEGLTCRFRDGQVDIQATPLTPEERAKFFLGKGLEDPFSFLTPRENYIFFKLRIENVGGKDGTDNVEFSPNEVMFGNSLALDETMIYQLLYKEKDGDAKLAAAGKALFSRHLTLPARNWIERLMVFQYDDPYPAKKIPLIINGLQVGRNGVEMEFLFKSEFEKE